MVPRDTMFNTDGDTSAFVQWVAATPEAQWLTTNRPLIVLVIGMQHDHYG